MPRSSSPTCMLRRLRADTGRRAINLSWTACAGRLDVSTTYMHAILRGQSPGLMLWKALAGLLGCSEDWLLDGVGTPPAWGADLPRSVDPTSEPNPTLAMTTLPVARQWGPFPLASVPRTLAALLPSLGTMGVAQRMVDREVCSFAQCTETMPPFAAGTARIVVGHGQGGDLWTDDTELIVGPPWVPATDAAPQAHLAVIARAEAAGVVAHLGMYAPWDADLGSLYALSDRRLAWRGRLGELIALRHVHGVVERRRP